MSKRNQEKEELSVFEQFSKVCPYNLDFTTAEKLEPPEPDIICKSYNNRTYYFELMQLIDENLAVIFSNAFRLQKYLSESFAQLNKERKAKINQKYNGSVILILLSRRYDYQNNDLLKNKLFDFLELQETSFGKIAFQNQLELSKLGVRINIEKIQKNGINFSVPVSFWNKSEVFDALSRKFKKTYERKSELIIYLGIQIADNKLILEVLEYAIKELNSSFFLRFWVFSSWTGGILKIYPMIK